MSDDLHHAVGEIKGKLDFLIDMHKTSQARQDQQFQRHDTRISSLERKSWYQGGVFAVIAAIGTYIFNRHG